jgi:16S rRNA (cytosine967-C5)-methyltransferase
MRSHSWINSAGQIIEQYDGSIPFAAWLKQYFRQHKKYGSSDRRLIAHLCYCFYRLGNADAKKEFEERLLLAIFLCSETPQKVLEELRPEWNETITVSLEDKLRLTGFEEESLQIFPFTKELSPEIEASSFNRSFLIQPFLYLRIRPAHRAGVIMKLGNAGLRFFQSGDCIALANQTKIEEVIRLDEEAVVQDMNSQKVMNPLLPLIGSNEHPLKVWDCCAASGGKSILFHDHFPSAQITVSDVRSGILINLDKRFSRAGVKQYHQFVADLTATKLNMNARFDLVICDAPCSGSGTWSRTPEQLKFFKKDKISHYTSLQKKIVAQASRNVKEGGYFLYITCSVFSEENEDLVEFIKKETALQLESMQYFKGYEQKADTLFTAVFRRL